MDRMDDYFSIRLRFNLRDDTNYCGPLALMLATGERDIDEVNKRLDRQFCKGVPGQKLLSACRGYGYKYSLVKGIDRGYVVNVVKNARKSGVDLGTGLLPSILHVTRQCVGGRAADRLDWYPWSAEQASVRCVQAGET